MNRKKIILLVLIAAVILAVRMSPAGHLLSFENLKREHASLAGSVHDRPVLSVVVFLTVYIAVTALSVPGAAVLTMAGGSLFGAIATTLYVNIGATAGSVLAFLAARYLLGTWMRSRYGSRLDGFDREMHRNGARYLLSVRLVPVFPFFLINILAGLTAVPLGTFAWTTAIGIIPGTFLFAYAGQQLAAVTSPADILSLRVLLALALLAFAASAPPLFARIRKRRRL